MWVHPCTGLPPEEDAVIIRRGGQTSRIGFFGLTRINADGSPKFHKGVDYLMKPGSPLFAPCDGRVSMSGWQNPNAPFGRAGFGLRVYINAQGGEYRVILAHLSVVLVKLNQRVRAGQVIGLSGWTGNASPHDAHLHFELHEASNGEWIPIDPEDKWYGVSE